MNDTLSFLDGNAAAGELREIFAVDVTTAGGQCAGCGRTAVLADVRLYVRSPGLVARCRACDGSIVPPRPGAWSSVAGPSRIDLSPARDARRHMT